jgi:hypothetical protein
MPDIPQINPIPAWMQLPPISRALVLQGGWDTVQRGLFASNSQQLLPPDWILANLASNPPTNVPVGWTQLGLVDANAGTVFIQGVGNVPISSVNNYVPSGFRIQSGFICTCTAHLPGGGVQGHVYQQVLYLESTDIPIDPVTVTTPPGIPTFKPLTFVKAPPPEPNYTPLILYFASIAINMIANAVGDSFLWGGLWYGVTGNMFKLEETLHDNTSSKQISQTLMRTRFQGSVSASAVLPYSSEEYIDGVQQYFSHHNGMETLPCFTESPLPKAVEVTYPVRFDGYVFMHTLQLRGAFQPEFPEGYVQSLVQAYLGIDVAGAAGFENYNADQAGIGAWKQTVYDYARDFFGYELVDFPEQLIDSVTLLPDPNRRLFQEFVDENTPPLAPRPEIINVPTAMSQSPYYQYMNRLGIEESYHKRYSAYWDIYKVRFIGLDFYRTNQLLLGMVRTGRSYKYIFSDNTTLTIEGILDETMINNCFATHPAKAQLLDLVKDHPIKPVFPRFTVGTDIRTNPRPCWGVPDEPRQVFAKIRDHLQPGESALQVIDVDTFMLSIPFDGKLEVPGTIPNNTVLTYSAVPLFLVPNHGYSTDVHDAITRSDLETVIADGLPNVLLVAGFVALAFPPLGIALGIFNLAKTLLGLFGQSLQEGLRDQRNNAGYIFYRGFKSFPSKFKVCRTPITLPSPTNDEIKVIDYGENDKTNTITNEEIIVVPHAAPAPAGSTFVSTDYFDGTAITDTYSKKTTLPFDQEVNVIRNSPLEFLPPVIPGLDSSFFGNFNKPTNFGAFPKDS